MSLSPTADRLPEAIDAVEAGLLAAIFGTGVIYLVGIAVSPVALHAAGLLTGLLAVAITVLWVGERI